MSSLEISRDVALIVTLKEDWIVVESNENNSQRWTFGTLSRELQLIRMEILYLPLQCLKYNSQSATGFYGFRQLNVIDWACFDRLLKHKGNQPLLLKIAFVTLNPPRDSDFQHGHKILSKRF